MVDPALTLATLVRDLERAPSDEDARFVRDQIVVKLHGRLKCLAPAQREAMETVLGPVDALTDRLKVAPPTEVAALFQQHPSLATVLDDATPAGKRDGMFISQHEDDVVSVEDDFGTRASLHDGVAQPTRGPDRAVINDHRACIEFRPRRFCVRRDLAGSSKKAAIFSTSVPSVSNQRSACPVQRHSTSVRTCWMQLPGIGQVV